ncbi:type II toxin-antitoxin system prevent-host-death family antitoxin [Mesorhizobium caraganae]|uniref:type II toxin-antitoxin system prevent-host-death family antitoxin n=1 Tax=Mesorhizobium caraganae TaxID=483206 RepID=UPI00177B49FE|nr:type II toxin-antitoxin system prevent-host-death family antitoxin [Mesorhizobium caraganae]
MSGRSSAPGVAGSADGCGAEYCLPPPAVGWSRESLDLGNKSGEVVEAAYRGPVEITKRGKRKFVLLTAEQSGRSAQRAYRVEDLKGAERDEILAGLDAVTLRDSGEWPSLNTAT